MMLRTLAPLLAGSCTLALTLPTAADVVISEVMYHPVSDLEGDEFLELYNGGGATVGLDNWQVDGIGFTFGAGASISPGGYLVLANDAAQFQTTYGFAPDYVYPGRLSDAGESLKLLDAGATVIDKVVYDDRAPWPVTADGLGPSLELIDPAQDNNTPRNWRASTDAAGHTAGAVNSVDATGLPPWISDVQHTIEPQPSDPVTVTAAVADASTVELTYLIDFGTEVTGAMLDDGMSGDGAAGDGIYGGAIPGQAAGSLIRFRISASGPTGTMQFPREDDTVSYSGTIVADP
ncbi:MAG: lamin tail domain-containing protein, partial [Planctomycetota bacterium]